MPTPEQDLMRGQFQQEILREPTEEEVQHTIDLVTGFAMPVVKMSDVGKVVALNPTGRLPNTSIVRDMVRKLVSKANSIPEKGPQDLVTRVEALKHAAGAESDIWNRINRYTNARTQHLLGWREWQSKVQPLYDAIDWAKTLARPWDVEGGARLRKIK